MSCHPSVSTCNTPSQVSRQTALHMFCSALITIMVTFTSLATHADDATPFSET